MTSIEVYLVKVARDADDRIFGYLYGFVQSEKKERIRRQRIKQNARSMLVGELLAKAAIKKSFGIEIKRQQFACTEYGKPYLQNRTDVHFSISHSGEYVACGVSDRAVGTDIQKIGGYYPELAKSVCSAEELKQIGDSEDRASEFTKIWTQKEAVLKMLGTGLANDGIRDCLGGRSVQSVRIDDYWLSVCTCEVPAAKP